MEAGRRVVRNSLYGAAGLAAGTLLQAFLVYLLTSLLTREGWGLYSSISAFVAVIQLAADAGITTILTRRIVTDREHAGVHVGQAKALFWTFSTAVLGLVAIGALPFRLPAATYLSVLLATAGVLVTLHSMLYLSVFRAFERMGWNAFGFVFQKIVFLAGIALCLFVPPGGLDVEKTFLALLLANLANNLLYLAILRKLFLAPKLRFEPHGWWELIRESLPLGVGALFRRLIWQVDRMLLAAMDTQVAVGIYSTAYQVNFFLQWVPQVIAVPLYPMLARQAVEDRGKMLETYARALKLLAIVAVPVAACTTVLAPRFFVLVFPKYPESVFPLQILIWAIVFAFLSSLFPYLFAALHEQRLYTIVSAIALVVNAGADYLLIPIYSYLAPCWATLGTEAILYLSGVALLRARGIKAPLFPGLARPVLASAAVACGLWTLRDAPAAALGAAALCAVPVYAALLIFMGAFTAEERNFLRNVMRRRRAGEES